MSLSDHEIKRVATTLAASGALKSLRLPSRIRWPEGLQVLLVEDDEADAYLIRSTLAAHPRVSDVVLAEDGFEALDLLDKRRVFPDMALVDLRMPRRDGLTFLRDIEIRSAAPFPCFVLTSSKSGKDVESASKRGAMGFFSKPKSQAGLKLALDRIVAGVC